MSEGEVDAAADAAAACPRPDHAGSRVRKRGRRVTAAGVRQKYECVPAKGEGHQFSVPLRDEPVPARGDATQRMRCPVAAHAGSRVWGRGQRTTKTGTWARYRCRRANGETHDFQVLVGAEGTAVTSIQRPPACPEHGESGKACDVTRYGGYGKGAARRQRYQCVPRNGAKPHYFAPRLSRAMVEVGVEMCTTCDEFLSPHRGALTAARHTPWTLKNIAQALADLAKGQSYAAVSMAMRDRRDATARHLLEAHGVDVTMRATPDGDRAVSWTSQEAKSAWHLAADLVEQYSPLLSAPVMAQLAARERKQREANDAALAEQPDAMLTAPLTYLLDEQPILLTRRRSKRTRYQASQYSVLVVVEIRWRQGTHPGELPSREARLRLVRAYPRANENAWRLVLGELPERPDYIVADCADAITNAIATHYGGTVGVIPSLYHVHRNIRRELMKLPGLTMQVEGRTVLIDEVAKWMDLLTRDELLARSEADWASWWDGLIAAVAAVPAPIVSLVEQRKKYEPRVAAALPLLARQPQLPASNASVEYQIRRTLEPFLNGRAHLYRNVARTNFLFDLAVCRAQGVFNDIDELARRIREDNDSAAAGGWAPAPRQLADTQPAPAAEGGPRQLFSSLLNPLLVPALVKQRLGGDP